MGKYVAFLRGINVGGKGIIKMDDLRAALERAGLKSVHTYVNSGNVILDFDVSDRGLLESRIETVIADTLGYKTRALVRSKEDIERTVAHFPKVFDDPNWKHNIIFLSDKINSPALLDNYQLRSDIEANSYFDGVIYWSARLDSGTRAIMYKLSRAPEYQEMTVRSIGTVKKVLSMM